MKKNNTIRNEKPSGVKKKRKIVENFFRQKHHEILVLFGTFLEILGSLRKKIKS